MSDKKTTQCAIEVTMDGKTFSRCTRPAKYVQTFEAGVFRCICGIHARGRKNIVKIAVDNGKAID